MGVYLTKKEKSRGCPSDIKAQARLLSTKLCSLKKKLNSSKKIKSSKDLKFFSEMFLEVRPLVSEVTYYVVANDYAGLRSRIDHLVFVIQEILGNLHVLHSRYVISTVPADGGLSEMHKQSSKCDKEIMDDLRELLATI
jgi:hypothetical protein